MVKLHCLAGVGTNTGVDDVQHRLQNKSKSKSQHRRFFIRESPHVAPDLEFPLLSFSSEALVNVYIIVYLPRKQLNSYKITD